MMRVKCLSFFNLLILFSFFIFYTTGDEGECVWGILVQTGSMDRAGTRSKIGLTLSGATGPPQLEIPNLEDLGQTGPGFDYFETGSLDIFATKGPCFSGPVCRLNLTSDGSGPDAGWYCESVEVHVFEPEGSLYPSYQKTFAVEQWLAKDEPPYQLAAAVDKCSGSAREIASTDRGLRLAMVTSKF